MLKAALKAAEKSTARYRVGCVLTDKKGNILSTGTNSKTKTHPVQYKYANKVYLPWKIFLHAEIHALCNMSYGAKPVKAFVARVIKDGVANAKPCPICAEALKDYGVKTIIYTLG